MQLFVGVDWAEDHHDVCVIDVSGSVRAKGRVTNDLAERDPACRMSRRMLAIDWPLRCAGSFDEEPKTWCGIDKDGLAKVAGQLATDKVQDKLRDTLGGFLDRD